MSPRALPLLFTAFAVVLLVPVPVAGQTATADWTPARTPWGDPDLQGQWNSQTSTPLERPIEGRLAGTATLPQEEAETLEATNRASFDLPPREGSVGTYNAFWRDVGKAMTRTSLIVDPPDGRIPPLSPEGQTRIDAERAERNKRGPANSPDTYEDLSPWTIPAWAIIARSPAEVMPPNLDTTPTFTRGSAGTRQPRMCRVDGWRLA